MTSIICSHLQAVEVLEPFIVLSSDILFCTGNEANFVHLRSVISFLKNVDSLILVGAYATIGTETEASTLVMEHAMLVSQWLRCCSTLQMS